MNQNKKLIRKYWGGDKLWNMFQQPWETNQNIDVGATGIASQAFSFQNDVLNNLNKQDKMQNLFKKSNISNLSSSLTPPNLSFDTGLWSGGKPRDLSKLFSASTGSTAIKGGGGIGSFMKGNANTISALGGAAMDVASSLMPSVDNKSGINAALDIGSQVAGFIPGPWGAGISLGLKGINLLDQATAKAAKEQATEGASAKGYELEKNVKAGTTYGGLFGGGSRRDTNRLTKRYDVSNLRKMGISYGAGMSQLAAQNTFGDIQARNYQDLQGGLTTRILSAQQGVKMAPSRIKSLKQRAMKQRTLKIQNVSKKDAEPITSPKEEPKVIMSAPKSRKNEFSILKSNVRQFAEGGQMNVIPDGALHARKNNLPEEISKDVTNKGIPVVTYDEDGGLIQHAEIEKNEIIFNKSTTDKLEDYFKQYKEKEEDDIAIECGKFLANEILTNTDDKTGLLNTVE